MRRRLLVTVMVMVAMVLVGLGVPLALSDARTATQRQFVDRLADTVRFASLSQRAVVEDDPSAVAAEMRRYDEVYGIAVVLLSRDGRPLAESRPGLAVADADRVSVALTGRRSEPYPAIMPWTEGAMLLAEPVLVDGEVRGAAVTVSPTGALRNELLAEWLVLLAAGLIALGLAALAALPVVRWIMRPVQLLDSGLPRVAAAVLAGRAAEPVGDGRGPAELRRLIGSFDKMAATVSQALAAQRGFVADASHQLRNPLTALRLRLNNLDSHVDPTAAEEHQAAMEEADRLADVLDGLLALAKAERAAAEAETIELDRALDDRLDAWGVLAEHERLALRRTGDTGLRAHAPAGTVETVLDAVLDNAIKFSPPGGEIVVRTEADGEDVLVSVRDHGPGLSEDELERATDRFWRSPSQHNVEGSGLGLAIARSSARQCGGELSLRRPSGGGLRVVLRLPAVPAVSGAGVVAQDQS
ncbi:sensor histidine kinase [Pseudonocardia acaciae]|uniref:sensor histidine kinase n=1 Tax=Pseudonocardia acaciae TaxID=551276 RepID=UPI0006886777|nr:HAMP domain-containing sensor histidine kinase [Pseudonocardia acaciae]